MRRSAARHTKMIREKSSISAGRTETAGVDLEDRWSNVTTSFNADQAHWVRLSRAVKHSCWVNTNVTILETIGVMRVLFNFTMPVLDWMECYSIGKSMSYSCSDQIPEVNIY